MKKFDLGQTITMLANIGVIAGIIFLGFELRQNNNLLESQARANLDANRVSMQQNLVEDAGGIAELVYKARTGQQLTDVEEWRLNVRRSMMLHSFESMYMEIERGPLEESDIPVGQWIGSFASDPGMRISWNAVKDNMDSDFAQFLEQQVLPAAYELDR